MNSTELLQFLTISAWIISLCLLYPESESYRTRLSQQLSTTRDARWWITTRLSIVGILISSIHLVAFASISSPLIATFFPVIVSLLIFMCLTEPLPMYEFFHPTRHPTATEQARIADILTDYEGRVRIIPAAESLYPLGIARGTTRWTRTIYLNEELFEVYNQSALHGVVAHERGHHIGRHTLPGLGTNGLVAGGIGGILYTILETPIHQIVTTNLLAILFVVVALAIVLVSNILYCIISRRHEYIADRSAAKLTTATAVIAFLDHEHPRLTDNVPVHHDPETSSGIRMRLGALFDTHPSDEERIAVLEAWVDRSETNAVSGNRTPVDT
jgi:Zn-dependent protease with chaperone function